MPLDISVFVARPFGTKAGIDFENVHAQLIAPVLRMLGLKGNTTAAIAWAGNIRTDMFEQLLMADIVIADISIHNANVYYELGIRHALRPRTTILIRARRDEVPFDLKTDRYLEYNADDPVGATEDLVKAIRQSRLADNVDSPVFLLLPTLEATDPHTFRPVPIQFQEEVKAAQRNADRPMLAVLSEEATSFDWRLAGLQLIGTAQFNLEAWADARATFEMTLAERPQSPKVNLLLATIYQRLGEFSASNAAIERVLSRNAVKLADKAEALALLGRNSKALWAADWNTLPLDSRQASALRSANLQLARRAYDEAFLINQNHYYSGVNSLALLIVTINLALSNPSVWAEHFESDIEAGSALQKLYLDRDELAAAVKRSLDGETFRSQKGSYNVWLDLARADLRLLLSDQPTFVATGYGTACSGMRTSGREGTFPAEAAAQQIRMYLRLGLFTDKARAALHALGVGEESPPPPARSYVIVFSGHRLDTLGRARPRFPPEAVEGAANMIRSAVEAEKRLAGDVPIEGLAGGASGGDILFHEICAELGIGTTLLLAVPPDDFAATSVSDAGPEWVSRFRALTHRCSTKILPLGGKVLPRWLSNLDNYSIWQRNNRWILHTALSRTNSEVSLIVLWDGTVGGEGGGTADMVSLARARGVRTVVLSTLTLV